MFSLTAYRSDLCKPFSLFAPTVNSANWEVIKPVHFLSAVEFDAGNLTRRALFNTILSLSVSSLRQPMSLSRLFSQSNMSNNTSFNPFWANYLTIEFHILSFSANACYPLWFFPSFFLCFVFHFFWGGGFLLIFLNQIKVSSGSLYIQRLSRGTPPFSLPDMWHITNLIISYKVLWEAWRLWRCVSFPRQCLICLHGYQIRTEREREDGGKLVKTTEQKGLQIPILKERQTA